MEGTIMSNELDLPQFLVIDQERRRAAWRDYRPSMARIESEVREDGPGSVSRRLGYREHDAERAARLEYMRQKQEHVERKLELAEKRKLEADDESVKQAVREHEYKRKLKELGPQKQRKRTKTF